MFRTREIHQNMLELVCNRALPLQTPKKPRLTKCAEKLKLDGTLAVFVNDIFIGRLHLICSML